MGKIVNFHFVLQCLVLFFNVFTLAATKNRMDQLNEAICVKSLKNAQKYPWMFITNWNFLLLHVFLVYSLSSEIISYVMPIFKKQLETIRSFLFVSMIFPGTVYVMVMFWSLYFYNRELIFPSFLDECIPSYFNHLVHTFVVVPIILEVCFRKIILPKYWKVFLVSFIYSIAYAITFLYAYFWHGIWAYKIFEVVDWNSRILLILTPFPVAIPAQAAFYYLLKNCYQRGEKTKSH